MAAELREALIEIAMEPDRGRERDRLAIADATSTVGALKDEIARLQRRLSLAERHARQLNDEYALKHGSYPL